jgi:UDP-N-acetylmuramoylalanine--D-glutamate ligase
VPWIGITGTNGKTTVTHLVNHLLTAGGLDAPMAGNVGLSAAERVLERCCGNTAKPDWLVVEVSSYQIEAAPELTPQLGIWTTLTPDHLERHGTLDHYRAIKRSLLERSDVRVLNGDDPDLRSRAASWDRALWISAEGPAELCPGLWPSLWIEAGRVWWRSEPDAAAQDLLAADALAMPGRHNLQNMLMAVAAGLQAGLDGPTMERALQSFPGVPHRLERLRRITNVTFYNDSKATNYDASEVGILALEGPLVVLAGGQAKLGDASGWLQALAAQSRAVVLYGQARDAFTQLLSESGYGGRITSCLGLEEAVPLAARWAAELECAGVLLSPGCASFDQYSDFEARGDHFRRLVAAL